MLIRLLKLIAVIKPQIVHIIKVGSVSYQTVSARRQWLMLWCAVLIKRRLNIICGNVGMADEQDSDSCVGSHVRVQVPFSALP